MSYRLECASLVFFGDECEHKATKGVEVMETITGNGMSAEDQF